ncbi:hypothetical protein [Isoptericola sp. NPDC055881]
MVGAAALTFPLSGVHRARRTGRSYARPVGDERASDRSTTSAARRDEEW